MLEKRTKFRRSSWPRMDFPSLRLHGPELQTSLKDCALDTSLGQQRPTLGGRFSLGAAFILHWRDAVGGTDASLPWLLWVHKRSMHACCALQAPGPEWLLGLPMRSWRAERRCALCCEMYTGDVFFLKCCDACWVLPVAPRGSEDPYKCHKIVCLVTQTIFRGLWVRAELQTSGLDPPTPQPQ